MRARPLGGKPVAPAIRSAAMIGAPKDGVRPRTAGRRAPRRLGLPKFDTGGERMAERPQRRTPRATFATVARTERLTPHMIRVVLAVDPAAALEIGTCTDHYVKLLFPPGGGSLAAAYDRRYLDPLDLEGIRGDLPRE